MDSCHLEDAQSKRRFTFMTVKTTWWKTNLKEFAFADGGSATIAKVLITEEPFQVILSSFGFLWLFVSHQLYELFIQKN